MNRNEIENGAAADRHVLVVGGAGYVGNVMVRRMLAAGYRVRVLDALAFDHGSAISPLFDNERFSFVRGDLRDPAAVAEAADGVSDLVLLAAIVGDPLCKKYPEISEDVNVVGPTAMLEALDGGSVERFLFTSTCSNYGLRTSDEPADETSELAPVSLYAETKVAFEQALLTNASELSFSPTVLRIATAYGLSPRMRFDLTISEFTRTLAAGEELVVYDADTWRPYCHIEDISAAVETVLAAPRALVDADVFNVGHSDENYTKRMVVEAVRRSLHEPGVVEWVEGGTDPRNYRVGFDKIAERLGFTPRRRVGEYAAKLIAAVRAGAFDDFVERDGFYANRTLNLAAPVARLAEAG